MNDSDNESPTSERGPRQIYLSRRLPLARFNGASGAGGQVSWRVNLPDTRLHWKITLIGVAVGTAPGKTVLAGRGIKLWAAAVEDDNVKGIRGTPVTDIYGTEAVPLAIPANAGLGGYSIENFTTAADGVQGVLTIPAQLGGVEGGLFLQARFQPATWQLVPWEQWDEIRSRCEPTMLSEVLET